MTDLETLWAERDRRLAEYDEDKPKDWTHPTLKAMVTPAHQRTPEQEAQVVYWRGRRTSQWHAYLEAARKVRIATGHEPIKNLLKEDS